jgi:nucleoside-diphosphate-sugar epimerase
MHQPRRSILLTGATGFLGRELYRRLRGKGWKVYGFSRHGPDLVGDITVPNLGLNEIPQIEAVFHTAAFLYLGHSKRDEIWKTNVEGTRNVLQFCLKHSIPRLLFTSTAYTQNRNPYEESKMICEEEIKNFGTAHGFKTTIFKPSIIVADTWNLGGFNQFILLLVRLCRRAEVIRQRIEGTVCLPVIEPLFRIRGNPQGYLNLVPLDAVAEAMAVTEEDGVFWLTNPHPPTLGELADWVGEFILLKLKFEPDFRQTSLEALFEKVAKPFYPYLKGDDLPSDLDSCPAVDKEFVHKSLQNLLGQST